MVSSVPGEVEEEGGIGGVPGGGGSCGVGDDGTGVCGESADEDVGDGPAKLEAGEVGVGC